MPHEPGDDSAPAEQANHSLAYLAELQPELRAVAVLDDGGSVLASVPADGGWLEPARRLLATAGMEAGGEAIELHVATPTGEVLAVREVDRTMVVIAERFVLSSLLSFDMRMALRRPDGGRIAA